MAISDAIKAYMVTSDSRHGQAVANSILDRQYTVDVPKDVWGQRYHLYLDSVGLGLSGRDSRPVFTSGDWLATGGAHAS